MSQDKKHKYIVHVVDEKTTVTYERFWDIFAYHEYVGFCVPLKDEGAEYENHNGYVGERYFVVPHGTEMGAAVSCEGTWADPKSMHNSYKHYVAFPTSRELMEWLLNYYQIK